MKKLTRSRGLDDQQSKLMKKGMKMSVFCHVTSIAFVTCIFHATNRKFHGCFFTETHISNFFKLKSGRNWKQEHSIAREIKSSFPQGALLHCLVLTRWCRSSYDILWSKLEGKHISYPLPIYKKRLLLFLKIHFAKFTYPIHTLLFPYMSLHFLLTLKGSKIIKMKFLWYRLVN